MSWLETLKNLDTENTRHSAAATDATSSAAISESLTQQGAKSAKRVKEGLLSLLAPPHIRDSENCTYRRRYREKGNPTKERPWLDTLRSAEDVSEEAEKRATLVLSSIVGGISEPLMHRGAKSAKSPSLSPDEEGPSTVNSMDVKPEEARRTLVTTQEQLSGVVADLEGADLVSLDLETTGLDPRKDSIRLLSLATEDATYRVDCQSVDPTGLFLILTEKTLVAHNALFDLGFLSSVGFEAGKVADTMILSQLIYAGSKVEPLKRGLPFLSSGA